MNNTVSLFADTTHIPLAEQLRPKTFDEVVGQAQVLGDEAVLGRMVAQKHFVSLIFWGPPGCGKTTLARLIAEASGCEMETISAVTSGVADLKKIFERATQMKEAGKQTLLFVDEIHRFNRAQQDAFLPHVENGTILLVGATTENPSFELNSALLSRCRVVVLERLGYDDLLALIAKAEAHLGRNLLLTDDAREHLPALADGDGRYMLGLCEELLAAGMKKPLDKAALAAFVQKRVPLYDKSQEGHYNLISALHKSMRGSDADASLYWFCRMLDGGEDPRYIARRLVRFAAEDIGIADPQAMILAEAAHKAYERLGSPEGELSLAQLVIYMATAPKSNAGYAAFKAAMKDAKATGSLMPPAHILNAPTGLMKDFGYGEGYEYDHNAADGFSGQNYFPDDIERRSYYQPVERGFERDIAKRMEWFAKKRGEREES